MAQHPTEEILNITRKFIGGELQGGTGDSTRLPDTSTLQGSTRTLPSQASSVAGSRAFGQQGARQRRGAGSARAGRLGPVGDESLSDGFFDLPGPVGFSKTPQGRALLQRILGLRGLR